MRLSDILKKAKGQGSPPETAQQQPPQVPTPPNVQPQSQPSPFHPIREPSATSGTQKEPSAVATLTAEEVYTKGIVEIRDILSSVQNDKAYNGSLESVGQIVTLFASKNDDLLLYVDRATPDVYLYGHSVNVCVLSIMLGEALGLSASALSILGAAALLHDIGLSKNMSLALKTGKLTPAEFLQIKRHSAEGSRLVSLLAPVPDQEKEIIAGTILHVHERRNGSGYPSGLKNDEIDEYAKIIAVTDVYESMSHPRPYHERTIPHEVLKAMIAATENEFDTEIMKSFIGRLSLYPPASYVKLNTDEIARVTGINAGLPMRPRVRVIIGANHQRPGEAKIIDLASSPMLFVKEAVDESKLNLTDKKLSLELKAVRWWVKGL